MGAHGARVVDRFTVPMEVAIRECVEDDLYDLEWFGLYWQHREIIQSTFESQRRGEMVMLVAEANGFPVGQVWVNLVLKRAEGVGALWAFRVLTPLQRMGIGERLLSAAEAVLREKGYAEAELGVETDNPDAMRFYEKRGYRPVEATESEYSFVRPDGLSETRPLQEWILRKRL